MPARPVLGGELHWRGPGHDGYEVRLSEDDYVYRALSAEFFWHPGEKRYYGIGADVPTRTWIVFCSHSPAPESP